MVPFSFSLLENVFLSKLSKGDFVNFLHLYMKRDSGKPYFWVNAFLASEL